MGMRYAIRETVTGASKAEGRPTIWLKSQQPTKQQHTHTRAHTHTSTHVCKYGMCVYIYTLYTHVQTNTQPTNQTNEHANKQTSIHPCIHAFIHRLELKTSIVVIIMTRGRALRPQAHRPSPRNPSRAYRGFFARVPTGPRS